MKHLKQRKSTRRQSRISSALIIVAVIVICVVSGFSVSDMRRKSRELSRTEADLEKKIERASIEYDNLVALEQYMKTSQYIEDVAKERLGMVYPDEIVIRPSE